MISPELPGLLKIGLEVGGVPVRLGDSLDSDEWIKACETGGFNRVWFLGKLLSGAGIGADTVYAARNQDLQLFGGKVFVAPDLGGGPLKYGTSASAFFRGGTLHRLRAGVTGDRKAATRFARQCTLALVKILGDPNQRTKGGAPVWWGKADRLTLVHNADAYLVHELTTGG
jgi:hypothetical protein